MIKLEMYASWVISFIISFIVLSGMAIYEYITDIFELPFVVWETIQEKYDEYE